MAQALRGLFGQSGAPADYGLSIRNGCTPMNTPQLPQQQLSSSETTAIAVCAWLAAWMLAWPLGHSIGIFGLPGLGVGTFPMGAGFVAWGSLGAAQSIMLGTGYWRSWHWAGWWLGASLLGAVLASTLGLIGASLITSSPNEEMGGLVWNIVAGAIVGICQGVILWRLQGWLWCMAWTVLNTLIFGAGFVGTFVSLVVPLPIAVPGMLLIGALAGVLTTYPMVRAGAAVAQQGRAAPLSGSRFSLLVLALLILLGATWLAWPDRSDPRIEARIDGADLPTVLCVEGDHTELAARVAQVQQRVRYTLRLPGYLPPGYCATSRTSLNDITTLQLVHRFSLDFRRTMGDSNGKDDIRLTQEPAGLLVGADPTLVQDSVDVDGVRGAWYQLPPTNPHMHVTYILAWTRGGVRYYLRTGNPAALDELIKIGNSLSR